MQRWVLTGDLGVSYGLYAVIIKKYLEGKMQSIELPMDLQCRALSAFDDLLSRGKLFYSESKAEIVRDGGFAFEFRINPALLKKPILAADAPERAGNGGPFLNPDPAFVIAEIGEHHILELSMHCMFRPTFILHTRHFVPQTADLGIHDVVAIHAVMTNLRRSSGPQMMIYNCGVEAGSSQGHKHMQLFALPKDFPLYPDSATSTEEIASDIPGVPSCNFVLRFPPSPSPDDIMSRLRRLVDAARQALQSCGSGSAYNVVMTDNWVCVIPRRHARKGLAGANGAGMVGLVWLGDIAERKLWNELQLSQHLAYLGIPSRGKIL